MKNKIILSTILASLNVFSFANNNPVLSLVNSTTNNAPSITLTVKNVTKLDNLNFNGLNNLRVIGREVVFNTSSEKNGVNQFQTKLFLKPLKAESNVIYVTAKVNDKNFTSNKINLNISKTMLDQYNKLEKKKITDANKKAEDMNKQIMLQIKKQQQFFDSINTQMQNEAAEIIKQQQDLIKSLNN